MRLASFALVALALAPAALAAQGGTRAPLPTLTLDEALLLARRNNPTYLQSLNGRTRAGAAVKSAYGAFIPTVNSSLSAGYREGLPQNFGGISLGAASPTVSTNYGISAQVDLSPSVWMNTRQQTLGQSAAEFDVDANALSLRQAVVSQYMAVLQQIARVRLNDTLLANTQAQLDLAKARQAAGSATELDVRRAEVQVGQQQVAVLQARNQADVEKLRLFQQIGVPQPGDVQLTTELPVTVPSQSLDALLTEARDKNPQLRALKDREAASVINTRMTKAQYLPTFTLSANLSGYTQKYTDANYVASLPPAQQAAVNSGNSDFPFSFTRNPYTLSAGLSLPIFDGFAREQRVQVAEAARSDAQFNVRAQELRLTADLTAAYLTLQTDAQSVTLNTRNAQTAREALTLAEQRYKVGLNSLVEVIQARADFERAESDRITSIFQFHRDFAALEQAAGRPLR
jgi:outer membrane protein